MSIRSWWLDVKGDRRAARFSADLSDEPFHEVHRVEYFPNDYIVVYVGMKGLSPQRSVDYLEDVKTRLQDALKPHQNFLFFAQPESKNISLTVLAKAREPAINEDLVELPKEPMT